METSMTSSVLDAAEIFLSECISASDKYRGEWNQLLSIIANNFEKLRDLAFSGDLKISKFRSICWSLLLRVINDRPTVWVEQKEQQRRKYQKLKQEFACNPHKKSALNDDPLSQSKQSVWNQYFGDQELFSVIKQDVIRTFPGVDFFRKPQIQEVMTNILFYYAREHPYMCYRQGMHEILAPILFVLHCDHQSLLHFKEISEDIDELLINVLDPKYLEADSYTIFSRLMSSIESYYRVINLVPTSEGYFPMQTDLSPIDDNIPQLEVISQLNFIRDKIFAKEDLHLHNHLLKLDIPLHIFGIRWLRLLFGREFPLQDLLILWDAIFADSDRFELPNYILVAMLIRIRDKLLLSDYTTCLTYLMRYPINVDISLIIKHALHMYMPKQYERPAGAFVYVTPKPENIHKNTRGNFSTLPRHQSLKQHPSSPKHGNELLQKQKPRSRSSSLNNDELSSKDSLTQSRINEMQYSNALNAARFANYSGTQGPDATIIDGYRVDSPQVLRLELQNAQTIMTISRLKLTKYLATLKEHLSKNHSDEINQVLDGIEELCAFLDVKMTISNNQMSHPVDPAHEADEACQIKKKTGIALLQSGQHKIAPSNDISAITPSLGANNYSSSPEILNSVSISNVENVIKKGTRYEIPDSGFMIKTNKLLGAQKDVELKLFKENHIDSEEHGVIPASDPLGLRDKEN